MILHLVIHDDTPEIDLGWCVLSSHPYAFYVDWCDGSEIEYYEGEENQPSITHTYPKLSRQTIKITGHLGWYGNKENGNNLHKSLHGIEVKNSSPLTRVSSNAFNNCMFLQTIDGKMFENCTEQTSFNYTFAGCQCLTSIPKGLFGKNADATSFNYTFYDCLQLTNIPADLFIKNSEITIFQETFGCCTSLTSVPYDLFKYNTEVIDFVPFDDDSMVNLQTFCVNDHKRPSYLYRFGYYLRNIKSFYLWNCMDEERMDYMIKELPPSTATPKPVLYLGVTPGIEGALTTLTSPQREALTAKGWTFGGLVK